MPGWLSPPKTALGFLCLHGSLIALINASNRLCVITRQPGGGCQAGQFG